MNDRDRLFEALESSDTALAREVAARVGIELPEACIPGVAANARLLQHHADLFRSRRDD